LKNVVIDTHTHTHTHTEKKNGGRNQKNSGNRPAWVLLIFNIGPNLIAEPGHVDRAHVSGNHSTFNMEGRSKTQVKLT
jgi:hypothetical protein